jgi:hypothetical protein
LADEILKDVEVALVARQSAEDRWRGRDSASLESCAFHLTRLYNVIEQMALRVAKAFENHIDDDKGWHTGIIRRLSISIEGVRPALFPEEIRQPLHELRAFRHVFVHAYDLDLDPDKLALLLKYARIVGERLAPCVNDFIRRVAEEQNLEI